MSRDLNHIGTLRISSDDWRPHNLTFRCVAQTYLCPTLFARAKLSIRNALKRRIDVGSLKVDWPHRKFNSIFRLPLLVTSLWVSLSVGVQAGAPTIEETCRDSNNRPVTTRYSSSSRLFAEVRRLSPEEQRLAAERGISTYLIYINPDRYYLGRQTQQWLYLRQCAYIQKGHDIGTSGLRSINIRNEEIVDCFAMRALSRANPQISSRTAYAIERDIERAIAKGRWGEILPGPQRRVSLTSCK